MMQWWTSERYREILPHNAHSPVGAHEPRARRYGPAGRERSVHLCRHSVYDALRVHGVGHAALLIQNV